MAEKLKVLYSGIIPGVIPAVMALIPANGKTAVVMLEVPTKALVLAKNNKAIVLEYLWTVEKSATPEDITLLDGWAADEDPAQHVPGSFPPEWVKIDVENKEICSWTVDAEGAWTAAVAPLPSEPPTVTIGSAGILRFVSPTKALVIASVSDDVIRNEVVVFPGQYNEYSYGSTGTGNYAATLTKSGSGWQLEWHGRNDSRQWRSWYDSARYEPQCPRGETLIFGMNGQDSVGGVDQWHPIVWTCQGGDSWVRFSPMRPDHGQDVKFSDHLATTLTMTTTQFGADAGLTQTKFYNTLTGALLRDGGEVGSSDGLFKEAGSGLGCYIFRVPSGDVGTYQWHIETVGGVLSGYFGGPEDLTNVGWGVEDTSWSTYGRSEKLPDFSRITFTVTSPGGDVSKVQKFISSAGVVMDPPAEGMTYFMKQDASVVEIPSGYSDGAPERDVAVGVLHAYFVDQTKELTFPSFIGEMSYTDNLSLVGVSMDDGARVVRVSDEAVLVSVAGAAARAVVARDGTRALVIDGEGTARIFDMTKPAKVRATVDTDSQATADRLAAERLMPLITARAKFDMEKLPAVNAEDPLTSLAIVATAKAGAAEGETGPLLLFDVDASGHFEPVRKGAPTGNVKVYEPTPSGGLNRLYFPGKTLKLLMAKPEEEAGP